MLILVIGYSGLTYRATLKDTGSAEAAWQDVGSIFLFAALGTVVIYLSVAAVKFQSNRREKKLRSTHPGALVLSSAIIPQLRQAAIKSPALHHSTERPFPKLAYLSLMATTTGISLWNGWGEPREIGHLVWDEVVDVRPSTFQERGRRSNGLEVGIRIDEIETAFPFVIVGAGFGGLFPLKMEKLEIWAAEMLAMRSPRTPSATEPETGV
jgi:hypothetical protein